MAKRKFVQSRAKQTAQSGVKAVRETAKGTIKTSRKSIKTMSNTAKTTIKTSQADETPVSVEVGDIWQISVTSSKGLASAIDERSARIFFEPPDTHSQDFLSPETTSNVVKFFEQTLNYNDGELSDQSTVPIDAKDSIFMVREVLNGIAMVAMILSLITLAAILLETPFFKTCKFSVAEPVSEKKSKTFWIISSIVFAVSCWAIIFVGANGPSLNFTNTFFSLDFTVNIFIAYLLIVAAATFIVLLVNKIIKKSDVKYLETFNIKMKLSKFFKTFLLAYILFLAAYISMSILRAAFNEDYRFWMAVFTTMLPQNFMLMFRYGLVVFPTFLLSGILINYGRMKDMREGRNLILNVILAGTPVYIMAIISYAGMYFGTSTTPLAAFITTWGLLIVIPLTTIVSRKMFKLTGSVWMGTLLNTFLVTWMFCSSMSSSNYYLIGNLLTKWFGIG